LPTEEDNDEHASDAYLGPRAPFTNTHWRYRRIRG
jgi:hypothetical protein